MKAIITDRIVVACGMRKARWGEKHKKRFVIFDHKHWHIPDGAIFNDEWIYCQAILYLDEDKTNVVILGGVEVPDPRR